MRTVAASRGGDGPWSQVDATSRFAVMRAILAAQIAGWRGAPRQLRKRARLEQLCGRQWHERMRDLLREAHVSISAFARGEIV